MSKNATNTDNEQSAAINTIEVNTETVNTTTINTTITNTDAINSHSINNSGDIFTFKVTAGNFLKGKQLILTDSFTSPLTSSLTSVAGMIRTNNTIQSFAPITTNQYISATNGLTTDGGSNFFTYNTGSWTPAFCFINGDGSKDFPAFSISHFVQEGYYTKMGSEVTVWFNIAADIPDNYAYANPFPGPNYRAIAITQLPFKFHAPSTPINLSVSTRCTTGEWPNGLAGDLIPVPGFPMYPKPYDVVAHEVGTNVPLQLLDISIVITVGTYVSDGFTALFYGTTEVYNVEAGVPPYSLFGTHYEQLSNFNILVPHAPYTVRFQGTFTYTTDGTTWPGP